MKNLNKTLFISTGALLFTPALLANSASYSNVFSLNNSSIQDSSIVRGMGIGAIALSNEDVEGSTLLNVSNGIGSKYQAGGEFSYCNKTIEVKAVNAKTETTCNSFQAFGLIPITKLSGAESTSGVGIILEKGIAKGESDGKTLGESDQLNFTVAGNLGIKNFDFGAKVKMLSNSSVDNANDDLSKDEKYEDLYGEFSISAAMKIDKNLRIAAIFTPESLHTYEEKDDNNTKRIYVNGAPTSYALAAAYTMEDLILTGGIGKETAKGFKYKEADNTDVVNEYDGFTTVSVGAQMKAGMFAPRAGLQYRHSSIEKGQTISLGSDLNLDKLTLTADLGYSSFKEDAVTGKNVAIDTKAFDMTVGLKAQF